MPKLVRWGRVAEIKDAPRVGEPGFNSQPRRLKHLIAWRASHSLATHKTVRRYARSQGIKPSSDLHLNKKVAFVLKRSSKS